MQITACEIKLSGEYPHAVLLLSRTYTQHKHSTNTQRHSYTPLCGTAGDQLRMLQSDTAVSTVGKVADASQGSQEEQLTSF